jgi:hypothetical protein
MTDLMAEYAEAGELDRPFIRACDDWLTKASASLAAAPTLSEAGAPEGYTYECGCEFTGSLVKPCARHRAFFRGVLEPAAPEAGAKEGDRVEGWHIS